jgi:predicted phage terminase large subunit-like protein
MSDNAILLAAEKKFCERSLRSFVEIAWNQVESGKFIPNWHIDLICRELEKVTDGDIRDLLVNVPPGTMKSLLTCVFWPAWVWGPRGWPESKWFFASYSDELTIRDSVRRRNLMTSEWYQRFWKDVVQLNKDQNLKSRYSNTSGGEMMSSSVGGAGLGEHPNFVLVDDAHKTKEAESEVERMNVRDWWQGTVATRGILKGSRRVVIMQRLHEGDLSGVVIGEKRARHICLPMFFEPNHPFRCPDDPRTKEGELLWPAAFTPERIKSITDRMPPSVQAGQLQQRPTAQGGGMFRQEWFRYFKDMGEYYELAYPTTEDRPMKIERVRKDDCWRFAIADTALTENKKNDPTAVAIVDVERKEGGKNRILVIEHLTFYAEAPEVKKVLQSLIAKHNLAFIGVEDTLDGKHIIQQFKRAGLPIRTIKTDGKDKVMRAVPLSLDMENEQVWFLGGAVWLAAIEKQLTLFPNDIHDDGVDTLAHACNAARNKEFLLPIKQKGVSIEINGQKQVIMPGTVGWDMGMHEVFGPKKDSVFKMGNKHR